MQAQLKRMTSSLDRLDAAVDAMHHETVTCRRAMMVFRARMDTAEKVVTGMQDKLEATCAVLDEAERDARRASEIFRATAEGRSI